MAGGGLDVRFPEGDHLTSEPLLISFRFCVGTPPTRCFKSTSRCGDVSSLRSSFTLGLVLISLEDDMNQNRPGEMRSQAALGQAARVLEHFL
jgi:hypothetical protein